MAKFIDLTGKQFGTRTVIKRNGYNDHKMVVWLCRCICGAESSVESAIIIKNKVKTCNLCKAKCGEKSTSWTGCGEITGNYLQRTRSGAKKRNLEFSVTKEFLWDLFLKQDRKCALSGMEIVFGKGERDKVRIATASLDRIRSDVGYIESNVQWIHKDINWLKQDFDQDYFIALCATITHHRGYAKR